MKFEDIEQAFPGADMRIETGDRIPWNWTLDQDEADFRGVEQFELDELKSRMGEIEIVKRSGDPFGTIEMRAIEVEGELLQQMIMTCEKFYRERSAAPYMFEALERLESLVRILPPDMDEPGSALAMARAALAKARGES